MTESKDRLVGISADVIHPDERLDMASEMEYFRKMIFTGLGVPKKFLVDDIVYGTSTAAMKMYERGVKRMQQRLLAKMFGAPVKPKQRRPYRRNLSRNAKKQYRKELNVWRRGQKYRALGKYMGSYIRVKLIEPSFVGLLFDRENEERKYAERLKARSAREALQPKTRREKKWRKYHPTEPYPWPEVSKLADHYPCTAEGCGTSWNEAFLDKPCPGCGGKLRKTRQTRAERFLEYHA